MHLSLLLAFYGSVKSCANEAVGMKSKKSCEQKAKWHEICSHCNVKVALSKNPSFAAVLFHRTEKREMRRKQNAEVA